MSDQLLSEIQNSIMDMQTQMQSTYQNLNDIVITGRSKDGSVVVTMTATYAFKDIEFSEKALQGGVKEFKTRIREAWESVVSQVQEATQAKTVELLQQMQIPDEIKNMSVPTEEQKAIGTDDEEGGSTGTQS